MSALKIHSSLLIIDSKIYIEILQIIKFNTYNKPLKNLKTNKVQKESAKLDILVKRKVSNKVGYNIVLLP